MTVELLQHNHAQELYLSSLTSAWRREHIRQPSLWLARDPEIEDKMLRQPVIAHAIDHRCSMVAGREWNLTSRTASDPRADFAAAVGTELIGAIRKFSEARKQLARAFFHGSRYALVHTSRRRLPIGDGKPRDWIVPVRLEDQNRMRYQKVIADPYGADPKAHWQRWDIIGELGGSWVDVTAREAVGIIGHVTDDTEETLGYGRGLREALGWPWYALTHVDQEAIGAIEKYARGMLHAKIDNARDAETGLPNTEVATVWRKALEDAQARHVMVSDMRDQIEVIQGSGQGWQMIDAFVKRMKDDILTLVLSANLPTGASEGGSYALANTQENSTEALIQFDRESLEETLTDDLVRCVWVKNHANLVELGIADQMPRFGITQEKIENPMEVADVASRLHGMGVDLSAEDVYERTGFRKPEAGEEIIEGGTTMAPGFTNGLGFGAGVSR